MNKRIENIEFRWLENDKGFELIQWLGNDSGTEYCIVVAFFDIGDEGCEIRFVGDRPFTTGNDDLVWSMLKYGQAIVDTVFELEERLHDA